MSTNPDIKKQLEAIYGHELSAEAVPLINFFQPIASYSTSEGTTTQQNILVGGPKHCYLTRLLDIGGFASTGTDGKSQFRLTEFLCPAGETFFPSVNVVATPISSTPCFLTVTHSLLNNGADVEITVFTWDANGAAAPSVSFNWRCRAELLLRF